MDYFYIKKTRVERFYLLLWVLYRDVSSFLEHRLLDLAQNVRSYVKDTKDFLNKPRQLPTLSHEEGLKVLAKVIKSTESLVELAEVTNNMFEHNNHFLNRLRVLLSIQRYLSAILFMADFEERVLEQSHW